MNHFALVMKFTDASQVHIILPDQMLKHCPRDECMQLMHSPRDECTHCLSSTL